MAGCTGVVGQRAAAPEGGAGGEGSAGNGAADGGSPRASAYAVLISEIMYHPVVDDAPDSDYEFVELHNHMAAAVDLGGWRVDGVVQYTFPVGASMAAGGYVVVAKDPQKIVQAPGYAPAGEKVLGSYAGELANGGGSLTLLDATGAIADAVEYDDKPPWPVAADALGAQERWLPPDKLPLARHQHKGISLERISFDVPAGEVANWAPSALDGATPGQPNRQSGTPRPVVERLTVGRAGGDGLIRAQDQVAVHAGFSGLGKVTTAEVEYFVDDVEKTGEPKTTIPMTAGTAGFDATLPPQRDNAVVRFRIRADRGDGSEVISPRPSDPYGWHAYFVSPVVDTAAPIYHLFIASKAWGKMWTDAGGKATDQLSDPALVAEGGGTARRTTGPEGTEAEGCIPRPEFDALVPAIFVHDGKVHDVQVRYQGAFYSRLRGEQLQSWPFPGPAGGPNPPSILSWHISFPRYNPFDTGKGFAGKRTTIDVKKANFYRCSAFPDYLSDKLHESVGLSTARVRFVRYYINGGYYGYMADLGPVDETIALRSEPDGTASAGDLFKADGGHDEGPWAGTDASPIKSNPWCPQYPVWERYQYSYERQNNGWKATALNRDGQHGADEAQKLIEGLEDARKKDIAAGAAVVDARKKFLADTFDLDKLRDYIVVRNWAAPTDDAAHNFNLYKRSSDGKWVVIGWDFDSEYASPYDSGSTAATSFYAGEEGDPSNRQDWMPIVGTNPVMYEMVTRWNRIKDAYFKAYRDDFNKRLRELAAPGRPLHPSSVLAALDGLAAELDLDDWNAVPIAPALPGRYPTTYQCNPTGHLARLRQWARDRGAALAKPGALKAP